MRAFTITLLLLSIFPLAGCEDLPWSPEGDSGEAHSGPFPATTYERRLLFLASGPNLPAAATFDFTAVTDSAGLQRAAGIQLATEGHWSELLDTAWSTDRVREPWRILPHGAMRVMVNEVGEIDALALDGDPGLRLETGELLAESSPDAGTQLVLRSARLMTADTAYEGVLLDAQVGRAQDTIAASVATSIEALLAHGSDFHAVVFRVGEGLLAWVNDDGESRIHRDVQIERLPGESDAAEVEPTAWGIVAVPELSARVAAELADSAAVNGYTLVSGWVEDGGVRRDVFGLVRHDR